MEVSSNNHWLEQYIQERQRLLSTLGYIPEGGILEDIQHIGATSVPGLSAHPCIDVALSIWLFPIGPEYQARLGSLGYEPASNQDQDSEQRFLHINGSFQLFILEAGGEPWMDYRLMRDFWRSNEDARQIYSTHKEGWAQTSGISSAQYQTAKKQYFKQVLDEARKWWVQHQGFAPVENVARELQGYQHDWYISGGWALDLFLGRGERVHHDVDVVVRRSDQPDLQTHLTGRGWSLMTPGQGRLEPWPSNMILELPRQQIHAFRDGAFIDFQLSSIENSIWRYRRVPAITRSVDRIGLRSASGIPFLAPEIVLLFKSQNTSGKERRKDQADFEWILTSLEPERRAWLLWAVLATDPAHPWIRMLVEGNWWEFQGI